MRAITAKAPSELGEAPWLKKRQVRTTLRLARHSALTHVMRRMNNHFDSDAAAFGAKGALLGLDHGEKTIGIAVCDPERRVAAPVETIRRKKFTVDANALSAIANERAIVGVILGLPLNMDGSEGPRAQSVRAFARNLKTVLPLPVAFWDERLSTAAMERDSIAMGDSRARRAEKIDERAATFILQGAIDRLRNGR